MKRINKTYATGVICILFSLWILCAIGGISEKLVSNEPGPKLFPYISAVGIILFSVLSMIFDGRHEEQKAYLPRDGWKRMALLFAEFILFAVGMKYLGFLMAGVLMMLAFIITLKGNKRINPLVSVVMAVGLTILVHYSFVTVFNIPLPSGQLWKALGIKLPF